MLDSYRTVLARAGALRFSSAGLVGRLPISMVGLGIVLLVEARTGSYGLAGTVSATFVLAEAAFAVVHGRLVDSLGQSRVLPVAITLFTAGLALMMTAVTGSWPFPLVHLFAAVSGAALPQLGACVRTRWSHVLDDPREVETAYALEAVLDEVVFIVGPVLVTVLATTWHPLAGLSVAIATGLVGTLAFAAQRSTEPPPVSRRGAHSRTPMPWRAVLPLVVVCFSLGGLFGAAEVATVAFADEQGSRTAAGWLLALWSFGSLAAGVVTGAVQWTSSLDRRVRHGALGMLLAMAVLPFMGSVPQMGAALLLGGLAIAPTLIATMSLLERTVPRARLTEAMAVLHTGLVAGIAPGAAVAGFVIDRAGASPGYLVATAAGLVGALGAQATRGAHYPARHG